MLISFGIAGRWITWKTAYDETFAGFSPGAQVFLKATTRFLGDATIAAVDSLATADHPLVGHLWPDRRRVGTVVIAFGATRRLRIRLVALDLGLYRRLRLLARRIRDQFFH